MYNIFKNRKFKEVSRFRFNRNFCDIVVIGEEQFCNKIYSILSKIEFEIFGKDSTNVPVLNDYSCGIDDMYSVNIRGAKENVKNFIDQLNNNIEYQSILKGLK